MTKIHINNKNIKTEYQGFKKTRQKAVVPIIQQNNSFASSRVNNL